MRKTFLMLAFAFLFEMNRDKLYPLLLRGNAVTMKVETCDDAESGKHSEYQVISKLQSDFVIEKGLSLTLQTHCGEIPMHMI
jgi:hypothetical protein